MTAAHLVALAHLLAPPAAADTATGPLLPGRYGMVVDTATIQKLPFLGRTPGGSRGWLIGDLRHTPDGPRLRMETCDVIVTGLKGKEGRVDVPRAFIDSIPVNDRPVVLSARSRGDWELRIDMGLNTVGFDPQASATMPTEADDPAVRDTDGDGKPGATMKLQIPLFGDIDLYVVQKAHITLRGTVGPGGPAAGGIDYAMLEQATIGATHELFAATPPMWPDPSRSGFVMVALPDSTTCGNVRQRLCAHGHAC